jgi:HK97 family phage prohead protease
METVSGLDVVRAVPTSVRASSDDDAAMPTMEVRFSRFGEWYEIDSMFEGQFLERTAPGSFAKTITESRDAVKVLFNHGFDPQIGDKVLGTIDDLREDDDSPVGMVPLFDTSYNRDLLPGLKAGVYGSSMRMRVVKDEWNDEPGQSAHNPRGIPERTIKEVRLYEFGPVTFPANPQSTATVRSMTDMYYERLRSRDPERVEELALRAKSIRTLPSEPAGSTTGDSTGAASNPAAEPTVSGHSGGLTPAQRRERFNPNLRRS